MKFTVAALTILATSVIAAPAPEAEAEPWCVRPGQSCKREATPWCMRPGQSCFKAKRAAEAFNNAIATSGGLQARSPEAELSNLPGGASYMAKRALNELANIVATGQEDPEDFYASLGLEGQLDEDSDANEKREALPAPWCMRPGQSCKREASPEADAKIVEEDKRWCMRPGQSCFKAKRAAEAVLEAIGDDSEDLEDKPFDPAYFAKRDAAPWCMRPGQSCKRDAEPEPWCMRPGQSCFKAKRDILAMKTVARDIISSLE